MKQDGECGVSRPTGARQAGVHAGLLDRDEVEGVLSGAFYAPAAAEPRARAAASQPERPLHYKVICISMYTDDLERLDDMVDELKARGLTKANRSALIRHALTQVDLQKVPKGL
jgi:hypothetical protein